MKQQVKTIGNYRYIETVFDHIEDRALLDEILSKSHQLAGSVNPHEAISGRVRGSTLGNCIGGLLSEFSFTKYLIDMKNQKKIDMRISDGTFMQDKLLPEDIANQIDLKISVKSTEKTIEIRSSFGYRTSFERFVGIDLKNGKGAFNFIGWYTHPHKPSELPKDFYVFSINNFNPGQAETRCHNNTLTVWIVGAASKIWLQDNAWDGNLPGTDNAAVFRLYNPIVKMPDLIDLINSEILELT